MGNPQYLIKSPVTGDYVFLLDKYTSKVVKEISEATRFESREVAEGAATWIRGNDAVVHPRPTVRGWWTVDRPLNWQVEEILPEEDNHK